MQGFAAACAWVGGAIGVCVIWPQLHRIWFRRQYAGLSLSSSVLGLLVPVAWLCYGIGRASPVQIITNAIAVAMAYVVLAGQVLLSRPRARGWVPLTVSGGVAMTTFATVASPVAVGSVATAITVVMALPQIAVLVADRLRGTSDIRGISRARWSLSVACNTAWLGYGVFYPDTVILVCAAAMVFLALCVLVLTADQPDTVVQTLPEPVPI